MANALMAGFHRIVHRVLPTPVGSRDRVTRYRHFSAASAAQLSYRRPGPGNFIQAHRLGRVHGNVGDRGPQAIVAAVRATETAYPGAAGWVRNIIR